MKKIFAIASACLLLAGCQTTSPEVRAAQNQASCQGYGFKPGTDAYASCMMQLDIQDRQADAQDDANFRANMRQLSANMLTPAPKPVTCNSFRTGFGSSSTTCY
ncbi:lipoprotein [Paradevosia shaoguanensis]|uniref:lipoprotein n=1 Tax=Paradevosia shaoguanensis TaxID=1335043 RepID=UPI0019319035|nr:hypothetical protein [Paradevosia shaoguanensis]